MKPPSRRHGDRTWHEWTWPQDAKEILCEKSKRIILADQAKAEGNLSESKHQYRVAAELEGVIFRGLAAGGGDFLDNAVSAVSCLFSAGDLRGGLFEASIANNLLVVAADGGELIPVDKIQPGPVQSNLSEEQIERVRAFKEILGDLDPASLGDTLKNFQRDLNPEREIRVFERVARTLQALMESRDPSQRKDVYATLMACTFVGLDVELIGHMAPSVSTRVVESVVKEIKDLSPDLVDEGKP